MQNFFNYNLNITKVVTAIRVPAGKGDSIHKNRPSHGLVLNIDGEKNYCFSDGQTIIVKSYELLYLPKHSNYEVVAPIPGDCYAINFDLDEDITFPPFAIYIKNHSQMLEYFKKAKKAWDVKTGGYIYKCKANIYSIISELIDSYCADYIPSDKQKKIQSAVEYIHRHYLEEIVSIDKLADMCGITTVYFRKIFKNYYGVSPLKYINNLKLNHAKELIDSRLYSVTEAAFQSGYSDISYFSREFKKNIGMSPSEYAKQE